MKILPKLTFLTALLAFGENSNAQSFDWGGSIRGYQFVFAEDTPENPFTNRRDTEFGSVRLTLNSELNSRVKFETNAVLDLLFPEASFASSIVTGGNLPYLPLQHNFSGSGDYHLIGRFDRVNLQFDFDPVRIVAGRQAITWGVTSFWPVMDLFSSFAPERIDRDFKEGVDAVRVTVAMGNYSEVQVVGAVLGPSLHDDGSVAAQARFHLGRLDLGFVSGKFHQDTVAGVFFTTGLRGAAYRGEVTWTQSGDPADQLLNRHEFWRASLGFDRQFTPDISMTFELSYNGFGASSAAQYAVVAQSDRIQRGEVNALGVYYSGFAINWQMHPLWALNNAVLINWQDPSALWIPALQWSTSDNSTLLFGLQGGFGGGLNPDLSFQSEYGSVPITLFTAVKWYF